MTFEPSKLQIAIESENAETSKREVARFRELDPAPTTVYVSGDGKRLTTWVGDTLAHITSVGCTQYGFNRAAITPFRAIGINGSWYYGKHNGPSMVATMRPMRKAPNPELAASLAARMESQS